MKIAIIHSRLDIIGGTQRKVLSIACALQDLGHDVKVYTLSHNKDACYPHLLKKLCVIAPAEYRKDSQKSGISMLRFFNYFLYSRNESRTAKELARMIDRNTDILMSFNKIGFRVAAFFKRRTKDIPSLLIMDDILTKLWALWRKSQFDPSFQLPLRRKIFYWLVDWYEIRKFIRPHEYMAVIDERTREWARKHFKKNAVTVRNGLFSDYFSYVPRMHPGKRTLRLLTAGIYFLHRRYEDCIEAIALLKKRGIDANLDIAGDYSTSEYRAYQHRLSLLTTHLDVSDRIRFMGKISEEELLSKYHTADVYISSNHLQSWGLAVFEAMSCGMPVVVSKSAGASEVLTHRKNAMLVSPQSPQEIADAVEELARSSALYESLSKDGREFAVKNITWEKTARQLCKIFEEIA